MKAFTLFFFLLLIPLALATPDESLHYYDSLVIEGSIRNPVEILATGSNPLITVLNANMSWYPRPELRSSLTRFSTQPSSVQIGDALFFEIDNPSLGTHTFTIDYELSSQVFSPLISKKVTFPLRNIPSEVLVYTQATETIDITPAIRDKASSLASGHTDLFFVVGALAAWTKNNVEYDLSTINVEASLPSSVVFETRQGVCDEITNLFISFARSLGIPARFVSGLSYTTSELFDQNWGAHGWAEVYFPGVGWVPYDVTYGQFAWVDATHIKFAQGVDSGKYASSFSWVGRDVSVRPSGMHFEARVMSKAHHIPSYLDLEVHVIEPEVGSQSYNVIEVLVYNPTNSYLADEIILARTQGLSFLDSDRQAVFLAPSQSQRLFWVVRVDQEILPRYSYTFPVLAVSSRNATARSEFVSARSYDVYSLQWAESFLSSRASQSAKTLQGLSFECRPSSEILLPQEEFAVNCTLSNKAAQTLYDVLICQDNDCSSHTIPQGHTFSKMFHGKLLDESVYALAYSATHELFESYSYVRLQVIDNHQIEIMNISAPASVDYSGVGAIQFLIQLNPSARASDLEVMISSRSLTHAWELSEFSGQKAFELSFDGSVLLDNPSVFDIIVSYRDLRGEKRTVSQSVSIAQGRATLFEKLERWILSLLR